MPFSTSFFHIKITQVPEGALQPLENLAVLDLSDNTFSQLQPDAFSGNQQLTDLNLRGCTLRTLHEMAFSNLRGLKFLDISNNYLTYIPGGSSLRRLDHLEVLRAGANQIREIKETDMKPLTNLKYLAIDGCTAGDGGRDSNEEFRINPDAFKYNTKLVQVNVTKVRCSSRNDSGFYCIRLLRGVSDYYICESQNAFSPTHHIDLVCFFLKSILRPKVVVVGPILIHKYAIKPHSRGQIII